jgi:protein TonB
VFDEVTKVEGGKRAARKGAYIFGSTVFQIVFVAALILVGERIRSAAKAEASVEVKFIRTAPPPPPPPPPAAKKRTEPKPKTDAPKPVMPPAAMIQPKEIAEEMKAPNPNEPPEPEAEVDSGGTEGGVVGGVAGGIEEAPRYLGAGFRAPREKDRGCLAGSMRVPPNLAGFVSGPITIKFAVRRDGSIGQVQIMSQVPDPRIGDIIRQGLSRCEWIPGADAQGNPTSIWVIQPIRFAGG